ncbi:MAG: hypothetical protein M3Q58_01290 [Bacteroidota bacterium]|nr:hypothetical protein [Bacteroidota bacterium]
MIIICFSVIYSCKTNKSKVSENNEINNEITNEIKNETLVIQAEEVKKQETLSVDYKPKEHKQEIIQDENKYSLVVSFYSKGAGIDYKSQLEYSSFLEKYQPELNYEEVKWGREGEIDYCIKLNKLSAQKKEAFISETRSRLSKSDLVHINENEQCVHKR